MHKLLCKFILKEVLKAAMGLQQWYISNLQCFFHKVSSHCQAAMVHHKVRIYSRIQEAMMNISG